MLCKQMIMEDFNSDLIEKIIEIPELSQGEILIKIKAAGICGSDIHMKKGEDKRIPLPIVLGHEGVGEIVKINGSRKSVEGKNLSEGDFVLWNRGVVCGECYYCAIKKEPSLCENRRIYGINLPANRFPYLNGCYSEYIILAQEAHLFKIEEEIDPAILVSASCSGATMAHAFDIKSPEIGDTVVIQGAGPLGIYGVAFAKNKGAKNIVVLAGTQSRLDLCKEFGATHIINMKQHDMAERREIIMGITGGKGADIVIEAVGSKGVVEEGIKFVKKGGSYIATGYAQEAGVEEIDFFREVVSKNITINGVWVSDSAHVHKALNLVLQNKELFGKMVTKYNLNDANIALKNMAEKKDLKAVLIP